MRIIARLTLGMLGVLLAGCAHAAAAQQPLALRATVRGMVWDSVAGTPLRNATVQLVGEDSAWLTRSVRADSLGRFAFPDIPRGRYTVGFLHPRLDSLGIEPPLRAVAVSGTKSLDVTLAIPSAWRIRNAACGSGSTERRGVVIGFLRSARDRAPLAGAKVRGEWLEYRIAAGAIETLRPSVTATSQANGWFALCNLPSEGQLALFAGSADSSGRIDIEIPSGGLVLRDVYVDTTTGGTAVVRFSGTVIAAASGGPLRDAQVSIASAQTRSDDRGAWTLAEVPAGTQMLDVRALGYYPVHRAVDVVPGAPPVRVELLTMRAMLDTIRVTATRVASYIRDFDARRRTGIGNYLTRDNIERLHKVETSQLFLSVPGVSVEKVDGSTRIMVRGPFERCQPDFYVDGVFLESLTGEVVNSLTDPDDIAGIEVYHEPHVPAQFSRGLHGGCGSVVIWRMPPFTPHARSGGRRQLLSFVGIAGGVALIAVIIANAVH